MESGKIGADRLVLEKQSPVCHDTRPLQKGAWRYSTLRRQAKITPLIQPVGGHIDCGD